LREQEIVRVIQLKSSASRQAVFDSAAPVLPDLFVRIPPLPLDYGRVFLRNMIARLALKTGSGYCKLRMANSSKSSMT